MRRCECGDASAEEIAEEIAEERVRRCECGDASAELSKASGGKECGPAKKAGQGWEGRQALMTALKDATRSRGTELEEEVVLAQGGRTAVVEEERE